MPRRGLAAQLSALWGVREHVLSTKRVQIRGPEARDPPNRNPAIAGIAAGSLALDPGAVSTVAAGTLALTPLLPSGPDGDPEPYTKLDAAGRPIESTREEWVYSWFSTAGELDETHTRGAVPEEWTVAAAPAGLRAVVAAVVRDLRGGTAWAVRDVAVAPDERVAPQRRRFAAQEPTRRGFAPAPAASLDRSPLAAPAERCPPARCPPPDGRARCGRAAGRAWCGRREAGAERRSGARVISVLKISVSRGTSARGIAARTSRSIATSRSCSSGEVKRRGAAARGGAGGAADAVDVVLRHVRQVEVHDVADLGDVDAARGDVGRDEDAVGAVLEPVERHPALRLRAVGVDAGDLVAGAPDPLPDAVRAPLRAGEDERRRVVAVEEREQQGELLLLLGEEDLLLGARGGGPAARHLDPDRVHEVGAREVRDLAAHRRGEEQRLPLLRDAREDPVELGLEPHVEHAVGLVEDEHLDRRRAWPCPAAGDRRAGPGVAMTTSARRRSASICAAMPTPPMITAPRTLRRAAEPLELLADLEGELARRREHERARAGLAGEPVDDGQEEGGGLAGAGRGGADDVLAGERGRDGLRLDRRRVLEPGAVEGVEGFRGQLQVFERLRGQDGAAPRAAARGPEAAARRACREAGCSYWGTARAGNSGG